MNRAHVTLASLACASALAACNGILGVTQGMASGGSTTTSSATATGGASTSSSGTTSSASTTTSSTTTSSTTSSTATGGLDAGDGGDAEPPVSLQDCVLLLHMDETSWSGNGAVVDSSGSGNNGTAVMSAAPTTSGKIGGAGLFSGGYLSVPDSATLHGPFPALTYAAWVNPTGLAATCQDGVAETFGGIISKRQDYAGDVAFTMFLWKNGAPSTNFWADLEQSRVTSNATFTDGQWYHLAVVYDGSQPSGQRVNLYVNGALDSVHDGPASSLGTHSAPLTIGDLTLASFDTCERFQGKIDEVAVWTRALTGTEIQTLYQTTTGL